MTELSVFHFEEGRQSFEDLGKPNGATHWLEDDLRIALGYSAPKGLATAILRAKHACLSAALPIEEHIAHQPDGSHILTRFGCYLVAMNADPKKVQVGAAQAYFAAVAATFESQIVDAEGIDRCLIRAEITDGQKSLASTAKRHGVVDFGLFQHRGYMGMYNQSLAQISRIKGVKPNEMLIDRMGKTEMAAHLFRITQTTDKISREKLRGQDQLENAAFAVGREVRKTMVNLGGTPPENLPLAENVKDVKKKLKGTSKQMKALDGDKARKKKRTPPTTPPSPSDPTHSS